jgi:hypothetical protein
VWIESSIPSSSALTWNGKPAPSAFLHKQLDVTSPSPQTDAPTTLDFRLSDFAGKNKLWNWGGKPGLKSLCGYL